jgi:parvulin-like peptidyl-prolyl isomerase
LVRQLRQGADFAELARLHSQDASAEAGGDLGYLHRGMLGSTAEQALAPLAPGEVSEPVRLLEGIAIFALRERRTPRLSPLAEVRARAAELCRRERSDQARRALLARLRAGAHIEVPDPGYRVLLAGGVEPAPDAAHGR